MIFHENRLPADDFHEISCLICYFLKKRQNSKLSSAANYRWRFKDLFFACWVIFQNCYLLIFFFQNKHWLIFFLQNKHSQKILSVIPSEWQLVWAWIRLDICVGPDLGLNCAKIVSRRWRHWHIKSYNGSIMV